MIKNSFLKKGFWQLKILLIIFCFCFAFSVSAASFNLVPMPADLRGGSVFKAPSDAWLGRLAEIGGNTVFMNFAWDEVEKNIIYPVPSMSDLLLGKGIAEYASVVDWTNFDKTIQNITCDQCCQKKMGPKRFFGLMFYLRV